jgi:outer membrane receptor protein involved in Fe transport
LLRSQHTLARTLQLDLMAQATSHEKSFDLPGTVLIDVRLGWRPARSGELSFLLQNVTNRHVLQYYSEGPTVAIPMRRTFYLKWTQRL